MANGKKFNGCPFDEIVRETEKPWNKSKPRAKVELFSFEHQAQ